jgi:hypothetical protein
LASIQSRVGGKQIGMKQKNASKSTHAHVQNTSKIWNKSDEEYFYSLAERWLAILSISFTGEPSYNLALLSKDEILCALGNKLPKIRTTARAAIKATSDNRLIADIKLYKIAQHIFLLLSMYNSNLDSDKQLDYV